MTINPHNFLKIIIVYIFIKLLDIFYLYLLCCSHAVVKPVEVITVLELRK